MTDLRELLREAQQELDSSHYVNEKSDLWKRIDAALAQPPDANPVLEFYLVEGKEGKWPKRIEYRWLVDPTFPAGTKLYAAPQPLAGKGEPAASGRIRAWIRGAMQPSTPHTPVEYNEECVPGEDQPEGKGWMPLYFVSPDVIPRKIHERLIAEKDRELEWWAVRYKLKLGPSEWNEAVNAYASEHERGG
jgi:hypothetical protein